MELRQLEYFEAVQRNKNFTHAAAELHVTQPTVTTAIKNLENELGVSLFDREGGGMELTPAGEELLIRTQIILKNVKKLYDRVGEENSYRKQEVTIGIPPISCARMYPLVMGNFAHSHPNIDVQVQDCCNHINITRILQDDLEIGFIILPDVPNPGLEFLPLEKGNLMVLLSEDHPLAKKEAISFQDLAHEDILMYEKGTSYVEVRLEREFAARNITWNIQHYFSNFSTIYDLVSQNFGISFTMPTTSPILSELPGLVTVPFEEPMEYEIGLAWGKNKYLSSGCRELIRFICSYYEKNYEEKPASVIRAPKG